MHKSITILLTVLLAAGLAQEQRTYHLKSGEKITGTIVAEDDNRITIKTAYGEVTIERANLNEEFVIVTLKFGDQLKGTIESENADVIILNSGMGRLTIAKGMIESIEYGLRQSTGAVRPLLEKFTTGQEQQIDIFYDPTGYTLDRGVLYVSGLSWGFGVTDKFQVTSKWSGYFSGDFNLRPKLQLFKLGNWEKEHTLAIGAHYHSRYVPDKFEWLENSYLVDVGSYSGVNGEWVSSDRDTTVYYGEYVQIGSALNFTEGYKRFNTEYNEVDAWVDIVDPDYRGYYETFLAYSFSKARSNMSGRINHTIGTIVSKYDGTDDIMYRVYYGGGIDIRKNLIMNYEIFYDPWYVEWWNRGDFLLDFEQELATEKPKKSWINPVHYDLGFIYSISDWLRFGIHFQPYIFSIYLKF
ncbi:MAG: hypothetical protein ABIA75_04360 [Candidatus Neomarinimicrobiota bacterium]